MELGADVNLCDRVKRSPLHWTAIIGDPRLAKPLLDAEDCTSLMAVDGGGLTPLMVAAQARKKPRGFASFVFLVPSPQCTVYLICAKGGARQGLPVSFLFSILASVTSHHRAAS